MKNAHSHRGRAAQQMLALMRERWLPEASKCELPALAIRAFQIFHTETQYRQAQAAMVLISP